jgi:Helix-turn-helix domain
MPELSTRQAARTYDAHPVVLQRLIVMGKLEARKDRDGHWLISKASLERWNRQRVRRAPKSERAGAAA